MSIEGNDFLAFTLANQDGIAPFSLSFSSGTAFVEDSGVLRLEPLQKSATSLVLSVGIHGNETGPIELVNRLVKDILSGNVKLNIRLLVLIGNPVAANLAQRFCEVNLNRLFSGAWQANTSIEARRAQRLESAVSDFFASIKGEEGHTKLHYDLHTAIRGSVYEKFAVYPFVDEAPYNKQQFDFLSACGIEAVLLSHQATTTFSYYSYAVHGAQAFTIELGKVFPFGQNDLSRFGELESCLLVLIEQGRLVTSSPENIRLFRVLDSLVKDDDTYTLNIANDVKNFTEFTTGYHLAHSKKSDYFIKQTGDAIVFPNTNLPVGQRAGLMVRAIKPDELQLT